MRPSPVWLHGADNDRSLTPEGTETLGQALAAAGLPSRHEIYAGTTHGYTMADTAAWDEAAYRRAFGNLKDLFARTLR